MKKRLCVLQVAPEKPTPEHVDLFSDKENCDFFFVTHDKEHPDAIKFCPNTTWVDTRNVLAEMVPKDYDYYAFVDYDYVLRPQGSLNALQQIIEDLNEFEPAVLTYYPGNGLITPFAKDKEFYESREYSVIPFTHCGLKIVHKSLMSWFFPMVTKFGGGVEACHLFNILEIPFLKNVVCSHKMIYDNGVTDLETPHNVDPFKSKTNMDKMWMYIMPAFKHMKILDTYSLNPHHKNDSLLIKRVFVDIFKTRDITPEPSPPDVNYFQLTQIEHCFDLSHEYFMTKIKERGD